MEIKIGQIYRTRTNYFYEILEVSLDNCKIKMIANNKYINYIVVPSICYVKNDMKYFSYNKGIINILYGK